MPPSNQRSNRSANRSRSSSHSSSKSNAKNSESKSRSNKNPSRTPAKKPYYQKLLEEYNPPFPLGYKWKTTETVKIKLPNPYVEGDKETVEFPVLSSETTMADRALFYQQVLDLENQSEVGNDNVPYLYHIFCRCLKGQALIDWNSFAGNRPVAEKTIENYSADIDRFIKFHESRSNSDLLSAQKAYMNIVSKPVRKFPSEFRAQLLELNNLITTIPETTENDKMSELDLKYLFIEAMPSQWRRRFQEVGKKARSEPFDELAHFFDLFHNSETPKSENNQESSKNQRGNRNHNKSNSNGRLQDNDPCPIHGGSHKWIDCHDNKRGRNYKPFNPRNSSNDQHLHDSNANNPPTSNQQGSNNGGASPGTSSDSDNPYNDEYNQESIQDVQDQLVPMTCIQTKQEEKSFYLLKTLLDSGGTRSSIARSKLPKDCKVIKKNTPYSAFSAGEVTHHDEFVMFDKLWLPEFTHNCWIENVEFVVFDDKGNSAYDVIIGRDLLERLGVDVKFSTKQVVWDDMSIPFVPRSKIPSITFEDNIPKSIQDGLEDAFMSTQLKPSDYNTTTTGEKNAEEQTHLSPLHRSALAALLH